MTAGQVGSRRAPTRHVVAALVLLIAALPVAWTLSTPPAAAAPPAGTTTLVSARGAATPTPPSSARTPAVSSNGRYIAFVSDDRLSPDDVDNNLPDVYLFDTI